MCESNRSHSTVFGFIETATAMATATTIKCFRPKNQTTRIRYCSIKHQFNINHQSENGRSLACLLTLFFCVFHIQFRMNTWTHYRPTLTQIEIKTKNGAKLVTGSTSRRAKKVQATGKFQVLSSCFTNNWIQNQVRGHKKKQTNKKQHTEKEREHERKNRKTQTKTIWYFDMCDWARWFFLIFGDVSFLNLDEVYVYATAWNRKEERLNENIQKIKKKNKRKRGR